MVEPKEIQQWLEWSGMKLLAIRLKSPLPSGYKSNWPEYVHGRYDYPKDKERLRPAIPASEEIALMDEILLLPALIKDPILRRIVNARALVTPVSQRYLYSWSRLAYILHTDRRRVVRLHHSGLCQIVGALPCEKIYTFRQRLSTLTT